MTPDRIDELIALAALGELTEPERHELDQAAATDPLVAASLDEALAAAASLQRVRAEEPPPTLRASVLASIASTPQEPPLGARTPVTADVSAVAAMEGRRRQRRIRPALLAAAAAVALFVAGGVVLIATNDDANPIAAVIEAPDATSRTLDGEIDTLTVVYSSSQQALVVEGVDVPVLDDSSTYQLWLVGDDGATSVGIFRPDGDGTVSERFTDADPTGFVLGVTEEPAGGSESPTLPILASA
jgi:hypothetical protein